MDDYRNSPTIKFCDDLFVHIPCSQMSVCNNKSIELIECASMSSNVLLISKASFPANEMN